MKKNLKESIIIFSLFTVIVTLINLNDQEISCDRIWVFHMFQKIANGNLIYTEINVIVGPVFFLLGGVIFKFFGVSFVVYDILGGALYGMIAVLIYNLTKELNKTKNKLIELSMIVVALFFSLIARYANYNSLVLGFIMMAMLFEIRKNNGKGGRFSNVAIGVFLGLAFLTKQTIGGMAVIATGFISIINGILEKRNPTNEILQKAGGFFIVLIPTILGMLVAGNLMDYIDLCFGGIFEFGSKNFKLPANLNIYSLFAIAILGVTPFIFNIKRENKNLLIAELYAIATAFFAFPLANSYHMFISLFFVWFIIIEIINIFYECDKSNIGKIIMSAVSIFFLLSIICTGNNKTASTLEGNSETSVSIMFCVIICTIMMNITVYSIWKNKEKFLKYSIYACSIALICFLSFNYAINLQDKIIPAGLEVYANHGIENEKLNKISNVIEYIKNKEKEGYRVYVVSWDASEYMAPMNRNNNRYDLLLNGNLGYNGKEKIFEEIKNFDNIIILKNKEPFWQEPEEIMKYIESNEIIDEIEDLQVYLLKK